MAVEVLLMADVTDLGSEGDIVSVADGYARNCLFPQDIAAPVTEATKRRLEKIRHEREEARQAEIEVAREIASKLENVSCTIPVKVTEEDKMFGSVTSVDIAAALAKQGFEIDKGTIRLDEPIKDLGVYEVRVQTHAGVECFVRVWVVEE